MGNIVTMEQAYLYLGKDINTSKDGDLIKLIKSNAEDMIISRLGIPLYTASYDEYFDIDDEQTIISLKSDNKRTIPVTTLTAVTENSIALTENTDFVLNYASGILTKKPSSTLSETSITRGLITDYWYSGQREVRVQWTAGYEDDDIPGALKMAALMMIRKFFYERDPGIISRSGGGLSFSREQADDGIPAEICAMIDKYKAIS